jgi:hypothetical protein
MVLPRPPYNPDTPIPNDPFFWPSANYVSGPLGPLIIGSGLNVSTDGILTATGGGGGGSGVTSIVAGTRITISSSGPGGTGTVTINANVSGLVTGVTGATPIVSSGGTAPVISILSSSTSQAGAVQLNDTTTSTATNLALTANQGRILQNQINTLTATSNLTLAGTINASNGLLTSVTTAGMADGFVAGSTLPAAAAGNDSTFVLVTTAGTFSPPGGAPTSFNIGDWVLSNGTAWQKIPVGGSAPYASTTVAGVVLLSTNALTQAGADGTTAVTPATLQSKVSDSVSTTSPTTIASSTAVKTAYDLANAALPLAGGTMSGNITFVNNQPVDAGTY